MRRLRDTVAILIAVLCAGTVSAQPYPYKSITLVVPFSAGGPTDTVARTIAASMQKQLQQSIVIENVAGAGGIVGTQRVARAAPDGYTLLLHHTSMAVARSIWPQMGIDSIRDFEFIGQATDAPMVLIGRPGLPASTLPELLRYLQANEGRVSFAHAGRGSGTYLCGLLLMEAAGARLKAVPYKGSALAMNDLLTGKVDLMCEQATTATPHVRSGQVIAYGVTSSKRVPSLPGILTLDEQGLSGFELSIWHALYAPRGTPKEVVNRVNEALRYALADPAVKLRFGQLSTGLASLDNATPEHARQRLEAEIRKWTPLIEGARKYVE